LAADDQEMELANEALAAAGFAVHAQRRIVPSLEDVFINQVAERQVKAAS
jgi:hypothetical protein